MKEENIDINDIVTENENVNEVVNDNETANEAEAAPAEEEEKDPLTEAQEKVEELNKALMYKIAEFDNYRKRTMKEKADLILDGGKKTITAILPVLDDFERALADQTTDAQVVREGMELIFKKFVKILSDQGVKKIETDDADFDTDFHEAIAMVPGMGDDKKGKVIDCVQTGYTLNDKVIRHAKVAVGQ